MQFHSFDNQLCSDVFLEQDDIILSEVILSQYLGNGINKINNGSFEIVGDIEDTIKQINDLKDKIKKFRQSGLEKGGEYSYENLTFKLLRRNGYIEKLINLKSKVVDKKLSITQ